VLWQPPYLFLSTMLRQRCKSRSQDPMAS
jgi:hypothetical protein